MMQPQLPIPPPPASADPANSGVECAVRVDESWSRMPTVWEQYPEDIAKQLKVFCRLFNINIQTFCWAPAARRFMLHIHSAEDDPPAHGAQDAQTRGYVYLHFRLPSQNERPDGAGSNVSGCYFQPLCAWQPEPSQSTHLFASRARALGERLQLLQQGLGLEGWPVMETPHELAYQAVQHVYTVTDDQLTPPPGSTFDRCLEELLFQQYGLSVLRHADVTRDEQSLRPSSEKHSLFVALCTLLRVPIASRVALLPRVAVA